MRIDSIEKARTIVNRTISANAFEFNLAHLLVTNHSKPLREVITPLYFMRYIDDNYSYIHSHAFPSKQNIFKENWLRGYWISSVNTEYFANKFYALLLAYIPNPPHPYKNVLNYLSVHYPENADIYPDFHRLREFFRTYFIQDITLRDNISRNTLLTTIPRYVRMNMGYEEYNKFLSSYIRPSEETIGRFTYIPDENYLAKDIQVSTTINKILAKPTVFSNKPEYIIDYISGKILGQETRLHIAKTTEEITKVFEQGPRSCMKGLTFRTEEGIANPASVYNTDTVGVLYGVRGGTIVGRAVINKEKKTFVTQYGDNYFSEAIRQAGYKNRIEALEGCTLRLIKLKDNPDEILLPYIDGDAQRVTIDKDNNILKLSEEGDICAEMTSGICNINSKSGRLLCENCDEHYPEDDAREVDGMMICEYCVENCTIEVIIDRYGNIELFFESHNDDFIVYGTNYYYNSRTAADHGIYETISGDYEHVDDLYEYEGDFYTRQDLDDYDLVINNDGEVVPHDSANEAA